MDVEATYWRCLTCGYEWLDTLLHTVSGEVIVAALRTLACPDCGMRHVAMLCTTEPRTPGVRTSRAE